MTFSIIKLKDVLTESKVEASISDTAKRIRVRLHAKGVEKRPDMNDKDGATKYYVRRAGQFVYGRQNLHKGAFGVIPPELDGYQSSSDIPSFDVDERCLPEWVDLFLKQGGYYLELSKLASGVGSQRISPSKFLSLEIPLPSIEQQRTLLERVGFYNGSQQKLKFELTHQQTLLKKLRQQILQEAIEGKLTADWRAQNPDVEPASELLKRIAAEKEQLIKDKKIKAQRPLLPITDEEKPFELPQGWEWCRLGSLLESAANGIYKPAHFYCDDGVASLRMYNIQDGEIVFDKVRRLKLNNSELNQYQLQKNDLLLNRVNSRELVGKTAIVRNDSESMVFESMNMRLRFSLNSIAEFVNQYLLIPYSRSYFFNVCKIASGQVSVNQGQVFGLCVAIPPTEEQKAIIAKITILHKICSQLETQITQNQVHAEQLMQAVLKEAFSHNNKAEPASVTPQASTHLPDAMVCGDS